MACCVFFILSHSTANASDNNRIEKKIPASKSVQNLQHKKNTLKIIQPSATVEALTANTQCFSGNNFSFNSTSSISTGAIATEFWDFGDGKTSTGSAVSHSYSLPGTYQVKLIVTSDKGCADSMSHSVTVYPQPIAAYIIPAGQCLTGNNFNFTSTATIGFGGTISSQTWNFGDGNSASGNASTHSFNVEGKYPVTLQVTSDFGCIDNITDTISVFQMPSISASNVSAICSGNSVTLNSVASGGTAPYQYAWSGPNAFSSTSANPSISNISINGSGNYSVTLIDSNGCTAVASSSLLVNQTPVLSPIAGPLGGCVGSTINVSNSTTGGVWTSHNNSIATVNASTGQVSFLSTGSVMIDYSVTNGTCISTVSTTLNSNSVILHPDIIECNNGITHFNATDTYYGVTYSNNNVGNTYLWTISGGPYSFQGASSATTRFTDLQLQTGNAFTIRVQFTSNGISCSAQQLVYKNTTAADSIQGSHDTTVCNNAVAIPLSGVVSAASNGYQWTSSGSGTFSNSLALHTTYSPSAADKLTGIVKIYFTATSNLNSTGNCGSAYGKDSMVLRIYPANMSANSNQVICSNQNINFSPVSSIPGSFYSWSSSIVSGTANGNSATGTGNINDSLVNTSNTNDAQVVYNITPFAFTPTNTTCIGNPFTYTVIIKPKPKTTITNSTATICTGSTSNIQFTSSLANTVYTWSSSVMNGSVIGNSSNNSGTTNNTIQDILTNSFNINSTVRYYIQSLSASGCTNSDSTDVLVYALPTKANAGTVQILCNVTSSILSANISGIGTGKWDLLTGPSAVIFGTPSSPFSTVTGMVPGTYQLIWSITNGNCTVSKDTVQLINAPVAVGGSMSPDLTVCTGLNSGSIILSGYTGSIKGCI
ncbi:MAG: PKD domain-containing protein [Bacteroidetes bacterium]|nr:PKD domain-containing protein [Bacteroidota bacterium]